MKFDIFPRPTSLKFGTTCNDYSAQKSILLPDNTTPDSVAMLLNFVNECKVKHGLNLCLNAACKTPLIRIEHDARIPAQGYRLETTAASIILTSSSNCGLYYGLATLQQILDQAGLQITSFTLNDVPALPVRGFMLDVSRCKVPQMPELFKLIDLLAKLKINQLQLYIEHTFAFSAHRQVWFDASPLTGNEILELDHYCRVRFIELVPNFNSFGHFERWLRYPSYHYLAESPTGYDTPWGYRREFGSTLKPNQQSLDFLASLYEEFLPNFSSRKFNICCDETWELGQGWSAAQCKKHGKTKVYLEFLKKIDKLVKKFNRQALFFGDIILHEPDYIKELPTGLTALNWGYEHDHDFATTTEKFAQSGVPFYVCPGTSSWNSLLGRTDNAIGSIANGVKNGLKNGAVGILNTDWGDNGHHQYLPVSYPGIFAGAEFSWSGNQAEPKNIPTAIDRLAFMQPQAGLGQLIYDIGNVYQLLKIYTFNSTLFNTVLFADAETLRNNEPFKQLTTKTLKTAKEKIALLNEQLGKLRLENSESSLARREICNALRMATASCDKAQTFIKTGKISFSPEEHERMLEIIMEHEALWLARNRIGGLRESSDKLRENLKY